jgi:hypothetical protein
MKVSIYFFTKVDAFCIMCNYFFCENSIGVFLLVKKYFRKDKPIFILKNTTIYKVCQLLFL